MGVALHKKNKHARKDTQKNTPICTSKKKEKKNRINKQKYICVCANNKCVRACAPTPMDGVYIFYQTDVYDNGIKFVAFIFAS